MTVNMAYLPKPKSGTKVLKMTTPSYGSVGTALTSKNRRGSLSEMLKMLIRLLIGVVVRRKKLSEYNILKENGHTPIWKNC